MNQTQNDGEYSPSFYICSPKQAFICWKDTIQIGDQQENPSIKAFFNGKVTSKGGYQTEVHHYELRNACTYKQFDRETQLASLGLVNKSENVGEYSPIE